MKRVRVLVANRPRLMREMLMATIADQPDIEIVGEVVKDEDLNEAVEQTQPDVLIVALEEPERRLGQCGFLLGRYPRMRILALAPELPFRSEMKRACKSRLETYFRGGTSIQVFDSMHGDFLPRLQDRNRLKGDLPDRAKSARSKGKLRKLKLKRLRSMRMWNVPALPSCSRVIPASPQYRAKQAGLCLAALLLNVSLVSSALAQTTAVAPATPAPPTHSSPKRPSLDERVKKLAAALNLDEAQQVAVKRILEQRQQETLRLRHDTSITGSTRIERLRALQDQTVQRIRLVLNDEQKKKYDPLAVRQAGPAPGQKSVEDWLKVTTPQ